MQESYRQIIDDRWMIDRSEIDKSRGIKMLCSAVVSWYKGIKVWFSTGGLGIFFSHSWWSAGFIPLWLYRWGPHSLAVVQRLFSTTRGYLHSLSKGPMDSLHHGHLLSPDNLEGVSLTFHCLSKDHLIKPDPPRISSLFVDSKSGQSLGSWYHTESWETVGIYIFPRKRLVALLRAFRERRVSFVGTMWAISAAKTGNLDGDVE